MAWTLCTDEDFNLTSAKMDMGWMLAPAFQEIAAFNASLAKYPNIKPGQDFDGYPPTT